MLDISDLKTVKLKFKRKQPQDLYFKNYSLDLK